MKKNTIFLLFFFLFIRLSFLHAYAFTQFTNKIKSIAPELKLYNNKTENLKNNINKAKSINDIKLHFKSDLFHSKDNQLGIGGFFQMDKLGINNSFELEKFFSETGTSLSLDTSLNNTTYKRDENIIYKNIYEPNILISVRQPLLYNSFGRINQYIIQKAKTSYQIGTLKEKIEKKILLNYYSKLYFKRLTYKKIIEFFNQNVTNTYILYNETKDKAKKGILDYDDVEKVMSTILQLKTKSIEAQSTLKTIEDEIEKYIPTSSININELNIFFAKSTNRFYKNKPFEKTEYGKILLLIKNDATKNKEIAKNKKMPELNFLANVEYKNSFGASILTSYSAISDPGFMIGLELKDPFGNKLKKTEFKEADLQLTERELEYQIAKNDYDTRIKKMLTSILLYEKTYTLTLKNIKSLIKRQKIEKTKYDTGRLGLSYLITTDNEIINAKIEIITTKYKLIQVYFDYFLLTL